ncbi:MAG: ABC transporter ATP-binding protein [Candidatus Omnitrophota bacterium]
MPVLDIKNLNVGLQDRPGQLILDQVSLAVEEGTITALVGGSGSGKSTTGLTIMGLLPSALGVFSGSVRISGHDLTEFKQNELRKMRGGRVAMIFQDPLSAFDPLFTVGDQIEEVLQYHTAMRRRERKNRIIRLLSECGVGDPFRVAASYPHQLSGGLRQRAMIAQALAGEPRLIIADEPTSSLDVTLQAGILELFRELQRSTHISILLITHDLGLVRHVADQAYVMDRGKVIEQGRPQDLIECPRQEYTRRLWQACR